MREAAKDRISNLPEDLLHHILSFLYIKDVARTSVLSKRWNYIWTTVPILDLDSRNYNPSSSDTDKFMDFVDGTLHRRNSSNIDKFNLQWNGHLNESRLHSWISTVIRGNVKELCVCENYPLSLPLSFFTCESLITLELNTYAHYDGIRLPKYICFPRLKSLTLYGFGISDECWNEELFSNSPVLEELNLEYCHVSLNFFCISIPTLELLNINILLSERNDLRGCVLKIHAPRLDTFSYRGYVPKEFILYSFPVLVEAAVDFTFKKNGGAEEISRLYRALAHAKCLSVDDKTLQAICSAYYVSNNLLMFDNVKTLRISDNLVTDQGLTNWIKAVPNLEALIVLHKLVAGDEEDTDNADNEGDDDNEDADSNEGENNHDNEDGEDVSDAAECTTGCLFPRLKSACFQEFAGNPREIRWVKLILRNAKALQMMTIGCSNPEFKVKSEKELMVQIPSFPRASAGVVFKFYSWDCKSFVIL